MAEVKASANASLSIYGKQQVSLLMYDKGKAFVRAAILLGREAKWEHVEYVVLHLLCQGIEVTLKALLLLRDYDHFHPRLRRPLGHNLVKISNEALSAYVLKPLPTDVLAELKVLSDLYSRHLLRYSSGYDLLVNPGTVARERVCRRLGAAIILTERELKRSKQR